MRFTDWLKAQPRGSMARLERESGISHTTGFRLVNGCRVTNFEIATRVSAATGGQVSIAELCDLSLPTTVPLKRKRRRRLRVTKEAA